MVNILDGAQSLTHQHQPWPTSTIYHVKTIGKIVSAMIVIAIIIGNGSLLKQCPKQIIINEYPCHMTIINQHSQTMQSRFIGATFTIYSPCILHAFHHIHPIFTCIHPIFTMHSTTCSPRFPGGAPHRSNPKWSRLRRAPAPKRCCHGLPLGPRLSAPRESVRERNRKKEVRK